MRGITSAIFILIMFFIGTILYIFGKAKARKSVLASIIGVLILINIIQMITISNEPEPFYMPKHAKYIEAEIIAESDSVYYSQQEMDNNGVINMGKFAFRKQSYYRRSFTYRYIVNGEEYTKEGSIRNTNRNNLLDLGDTVKIVYNSQNPYDAGVVGEEGKIIRINYYLNYVVMAFLFIMELIVLIVNPKKERNY